MACLAAITDAVLRVRACDVPSLFCLHYAGQAEGPVQPFAPGGTAARDPGPGPTVALGGQATG